MNQNLANKTNKNEIYYQNKFLQLYKQSGLLVAGEEVRQCMSPYPAYHFISDRGCLYSVYGKQLILRKPSWQYQQKNKQDTDRNVWVYSYTNRITGKQEQVKMHILLAKHFRVNRFAQFAPNDLNSHVHHINPTHNYTSQQAYDCNRLNNLQVAPSTLHYNILNQLERNPQWINKKLDEAAGQQIQEIQPQTASELYYRYCLNSYIKHHPEACNHILAITQDLQEDNRRTMLSLLSDFKVSTDC